MPPPQIIFLIYACTCTCTWYRRKQKRDEKKDPTINKQHQEQRRQRQSRWTIYYEGKRDFIENERGGGYNDIPESYISFPACTNISKHSHRTRLLASLDSPPKPPPRPQKAQGTATSQPSQNSGSHPLH